MLQSLYRRLSDWEEEDPGGNFSVNLLLIELLRAFSLYKSDYMFLLKCYRQYFFC